MFAAKSPKMRPQPCAYGCLYNSFQHIHSHRVVAFSFRCFCLSCMSLSREGALVLDPFNNICSSKCTHSHTNSSEGSDCWGVEKKTNKRKNSMSTWQSPFEQCTQSTTSSLWIKPHPTRCAEPLSSCFQWLSHAIQCLSNAFESILRMWQTQFWMYSHNFVYEVIGCVHVKVRMQSLGPDRGSSCSHHCSIQFIKGVWIGSVCQNP